MKIVLERMKVKPVFCEGMNVFVLGTYQDNVFDYFPGVVTSISADGKYSVRRNDGLAEQRVPHSKLKAERLKVKYTHDT